MNKSNIFLSIILALFFQLNALAYEMKIGKIEFSGNEKTSESVLNSVIKLKQGDDFTEEQIEKAVQYLKNTTVFSNVTSEKSIDPLNKNIVNIKFIVDEKWTIIAAPNAGSSGGVTSYGLTVIDTNFLGRLYSFGINFSMINSKPNGYIFFGNEHTLDLPLITQISAAYSDQKVQLYARDNEIGYFSAKTISANPSFLWKFHDHLKLGSGLLIQQTEKINDQLTDGEFTVNKQNNIQTPNSFTTTAFQILGQFGTMNHEGLTQQGITLGTTINTTAGIYAGSNNADDYTSVSNMLLAFYKLPFDKKSNLAFRLAQSATSSNNPIQQIYLGSEQIRGFKATQFNGKFGMFSNLEYRLTAYHGEYVAFQFVPFVDSGIIGESMKNAFDNQIISSYGVGIRVPFTKINGLTIRLDYGQTISPFSTDGAGLSLTQFF